MIKRIKDRFSKDSTDVEKLNKRGYVPSQEELETDLGWSKLSKHKRDYDFQGEHKCLLCPKKLLNTDQELREHLVSKGHAKNLQHFYRKNRDELNKRASRLFARRSLKIQRYSAKYKRLAWVSHYFRTRGTLMKMA